ncbi:MAG: hypothetical protein K2M52_02085, partial [Paramuribaculum sp.]|nr:hypothetical protein [Paramuribaculum sp.]
MIIGFHIEYHTSWGERLCVAGSSPALGNSDEGAAVEMHTSDGRFWYLDV